MNDDLERYRKLLEDWQVQKPVQKPRREPQSPVAQEVPLRTAAAGSSRAKLTRRAEEGGGRYPIGTILCLDDEEMVVYRRAVSDKSYDMVYSLLSDGSVKIEGVDIGNHQVDELGVMQSRDLRTLQSDMCWTRDLIAFNCSREEDSDRIPDPGAETPKAKPAAQTRAPEPAPETARKKAKSSRDPIEQLTAGEGAGRVVEDEPGTNEKSKVKIKRGSSFTIKFGDRMWNAIYWGMDGRGTVVAHKTHGQWTLMHLDLNRFKESLVVQPGIDEKLVSEISADLKATQLS